MRRAVALLCLTACGGDPGGAAGAGGSGGEGGDAWRVVHEDLPGALNLTTDIGRCATLWGVYVKPEARGSHVAWKLQDMAVQEGRALGFKTVVSTVLLGYPAAEKNAFNWTGNAEKHATMIFASLEESDGR